MVKPLFKASNIYSSEQSYREKPIQSVKYLLKWAILWWKTYSKRQISTQVSNLMVKTLFKASNIYSSEQSYGEKPIQSVKYLFKWAILWWKTYSKRQISIQGSNLMVKNLFKASNIYSSEQSYGEKPIQSVKCLLKWAILWWKPYSKRQISTQGSNLMVKTLFKASNIYSSEQSYGQISCSLPLISSRVTVGTHARTRTHAHTHTHSLLWCNHVEDAEFVTLYSVVQRVT